MPSARISNTTPFTTYSMWVTAKNDIGEGETAGPVYAQFNCGYARFDESSSSGFTFSTLTNPDGDGKNYRLASCTSSGNKTIALELAGFVQILMVGGGGNGYSNMVDKSGGGGGGQVFETILNLDEGSHGVYVGENGKQGYNYPTRNSGRTRFYTTLADKEQIIVLPGGNAPSSGGGGHSGNGYYTGGQLISGGSGAGGVNSGHNGGPGVASSITGTSVTYGLGGANLSHTNRPGCGGSAGAAGRPGAVYMRVEI